MTEEILQEADLSAEERLRWHKPEVKRLIINVDTRIAKDALVDYSGGDLENP